MQQGNIEMLYAKYGKDFVDTVLWVIMDNIPNLKKGRRYKTSYLIGRVLWDHTTAKEHQTMGWIVLGLVAGGHVPLKPACKTANHHNRYELC